MRKIGIAKSVRQFLQANVNKFIGVPDVNLALIHPPLITRYWFFQSLSHNGQINGRTNTTSTSVSKTIGRPALI